MGFRSYKYASPFLIYAGALVSFFSHGWIIWLPLLYTWAVIPLVELLLKPDDTNLSQAEEELVKKDKTVNYIEHYGLVRRTIGNGKYERAMPEHSWNSLSRHRSCNVI